MLPMSDITQTIIDPLLKAGALGAVVLWFMWRDGRERDRQAAREDRLDRRFDALVESVGHLIRVTSLEVMTRPSMTQRTKDELAELIAAIEHRRKTDA